MTIAPDLPPPPAPVSVTERGYAVANSGNGYYDTLQAETTPELRWPANIPILGRMRDQDAQVSSVLQAVIAPILRTGWYVDDTDVDEPVALDIASNVGLPIKGKPNSGVVRMRGRDRFSWIQHLLEALESLVYGHAVFEQTYRWDYERLRWRIRKLGYRPAATIAKWNIADDGGLVSIEQHPRASIGGGLITSDTITRKALEVDRLVVYSHNRRGGDWRGNSLVRACYKNWLLKDDLLRTQAQAAQRQGMGLPVYTAAPNETNLDPGRRIAQAARAGDNSGAALANGQSLKLLGVEGNLIDPDKAIRYHDEQIARAVLAHFLNLGSQTGSWALGSTFADFFTLALQAIAQWLAETASQHIVEDLVDINWGTAAAAPVIAFDEIGSRGVLEGQLAQVRKATGLEDDDDLAAWLQENVAA